MALTGRVRYRAGAFGKLVLQVEHAHHYREWRDATLGDMQEIGPLACSVCQAPGTCRSDARPHIPQPASI